MTGLTPLALPVGVIIATLVSAIGIGGGILWMPFFIIFFRLPLETAVVTSLLVQTAGMGSGSAAFIKKRTADLPLAGLLLLLTLPGLGLVDAGMGRARGHHRRADRSALYREDQRAGAQGGFYLPAHAHRHSSDL